MWDLIVSVPDHCVSFYYECFSNKTCYYCGRENHHHRRLCSKKFVRLIKIETALIDDLDSKQIMRDCQTEMKQQLEHEASGNRCEGSN